MPGQLHAIVSLHETLTDLAEAETSLNEIPDWMAELHREHGEKEAEIKTLVESAEEAGKIRREAEAALADAQEKLKRYQDQISQVTTQREYGALLKEIELVKEEIAAQEQTALDSLSVHEEADGKRQALTAEFESLESRYQEELAKWEKEKPAIATRAEALRERSAELREQVPRPQRALYDRLHSRFAKGALAPVTVIMTPGGKSKIWSCGACNYRVRPQLVVEIRSEGRVVQCDACKRILFDGTGRDDNDEEE
ncbi:MAG: C4-type zinc ribbon domain-containing protein [Acidobacteriota bacterium]